MQFAKLKLALTIAVFSTVVLSKATLAGPQARFKLVQPVAEAILEYGDKGEKIPLNKIVKLTLHLKTKENLELTSFDASMPEHNHGMVTKAQIKKIDKEKFEISGVNLHMSGHWLFAIHLADGKGKLFTATSDYQME